MVAPMAAAQLDSTVATASLRKATQFMQQNVAVHGGYAWVASADGRFSHGEGVAGPQRVWVQPPGTPAVGIALLRAHKTTGDSIHLDAAREAAEALIQGQLRSGGWGYSIEFDPTIRKKITYRVGPNGGHDKIPPHRAPADGTCGSEESSKPTRRSLTTIQRQLPFAFLPGWIND